VTSESQFFDEDTGVWKKNPFPFPPMSIKSDNFERIFKSYRLVTEDKAGNYGISLFEFNPKSYFIRNLMKKLNGDDVVVSRKLNFEIDNLAPKNVNPSGLFDWSTGDKVAYLIQAFTYTPADLEFITIKTQYTDPTTGEEFFSDIIFKEPLSLEEAQTYRPSIIDNVNVDSLLDFVEQPVFILELDKQDFPDTTALITLTIELGDN